MTIVDVMRRIYSDIRSCWNGTFHLNFINYGINENGSTTLFYYDSLNFIKNVDLSVSETKIWTAYKDSDRLDGGFWPIITTETPMEELKEIHRFIWDIVMDKGWKPRTPYLHDCIGCEYCRAYAHKHSKSSCVNICPIAWGFNNTDGLNGTCGDEYYHWCITRNVYDAKIIRDIPFKFELEENKND